MRRELIVKRQGVLVLIATSFLIVLYTAYNVYNLNIYKGSSVSNLKRRLSIQNSNALLKLRLTNANYHFYSYDFENSLKDYTDTIELNPVLRQAWLDITEPLLNENRSEDALLIIKYIKSITPYSNDLHWDLGLQLVRINEQELAVNTLVEVVQNNYWKRAHVFILFDKLDVNKKYIIERLGSFELLKAYLEHLISKRYTTDALYLWENMANKHDDLDENLKDRFVEFLISQNKYKYASDIWHKGNKELHGTNLIWNGDFEYDIENKGFDWRLTNTREANIEIDRIERYSGENSLKIEFNGEKNINFHHVKKYIPVEPETEYLLSYAQKNSDITTKSGVYVEIMCGNSRVTTKTEDVSGSSPWIKKEKLFATESGCEGVMIQLKRDPVRKLNNKISGTVWFDDISLEAIH